jgi:hypothetical protein
VILSATARTVKRRTVETVATCLFATVLDLVVGAVTLAILAAGTYANRTHGRK